MITVDFITKVMKKQSKDNVIFIRGLLFFIAKEILFFVTVLIYIFMGVVHCCVHIFIRCKMQQLLALKCINPVLFFCLAIKCVYTNHIVYLPSLSEVTKSIKGYYCILICI